MDTSTLVPATVPSIHVFEKAGLGKAPYRYLGMEELRGPLAMPGGGFCGAPGQPMGSCQYCSTGIAYLFWLESADGEKFYVGSDCIYKSGDAGLRRIIEPIVAQHQATLRADRNRLLIDLFEDYLKKNPTYWSDDKRPHPFSWAAAQGKTYGDYSRFVYEHSGSSNKAAKARQFLIAANVALPRRDTAGRPRWAAQSPLPPRWNASSPACMAASRSSTWETTPNPVCSGRGRASGVGR
jgi:hypothetical protein